MLFIYIILFFSYTVHPQLFEQAELNLKTGRWDLPKIRIIENRLNHNQNG